MECAICIQPIYKSCIGSCTHHYCYSCMIKWCKHNDKCPKCRTPIREIHYDQEFDLINGALNTELTHMPNDIKEIYLKLPENKLAGITLKNNNKGPGVIIKKLDKNGQAKKCNFKVGDIILFMNGCPCLNHKQSIEIINQATLSTKNVICILL